MRLQAWIGFCFTVVLSVIGTGGGAGAEEIMLGGMCDRTGPTKNIGLQACHGVLDYIKLVNAKGGIKGTPLRYIEVEHAFKVDRGVEAYERLKRQGAVTMALLLSTR